MALNFKRLNDGDQLTVAALAYYTTPALTTTVIKKLTLCNTSGADQTATVYLPVAGVAAGAANTLEYQRTVPAGKTIDITDAINHVLPAGASLRALASAGAAITLLASGIEST